MEPTLTSGTRPCGPGLPAFVHRQPRLPAFTDTASSTAQHSLQPGAQLWPPPGKAGTKFHWAFGRAASGLEPQLSPSPASVSPSVAWVCPPWLPVGSLRIDGAVWAEAGGGGRHHP